MRRAILPISSKTSGVASGESRSDLMRSRNSRSCSRLAGTLRPASPITSGSRAAHDIREQANQLEDLETAEEHFERGEAGALQRVVALAPEVLRDLLGEPSELLAEL